MAGLVPAIHVSRHRGASREGARRRPDVDTRNKSGHDDRGAGDIPIAEPHQPTARHAARSASNASEIFSAHMMVGMLVLARGTQGKIEASHTVRPSTP